MADMNELYSALLKADAAGDTESARTLAGYIQSQQAATAGLAALETPSRGRRPEDVGFLEGAGASLKKGVTSFGDVASGYGLAGESLTGSRAEVQAKMDAIKREAQKIEETPGLAFADIQRLYKERGLLDALAQLPKYATEQILQSAPQMAVPLAVGAGAGALSGPLAPIVGPLAGVTAYGAQQFGNFMQRQGQEAKTPEDLSVARAAGTAAATAPLGYFVDRFTAGLGGMGEKGLIEVGKELAKRKAAGEIGAAGVTAGVAKQAGKGAATGFIAEAPTEVLESVAERYQAGLPLTDDKAKQEYLESFMGAGVAGGAIGGGSRAVSGAKAYKQAQAEEAKVEAEKQAVAEVAQVAQPVIEEEAVAPTTVAQPEPVQDVNAPSQDREAMLKELEDQLTAIGEEPPLKQVTVEPVAETQQPVAEAPVTEPVVEEAPVEAPKAEVKPVTMPYAEQASKTLGDLLNRKHEQTISDKVNPDAVVDQMLRDLARRDTKYAEQLLTAFQQDPDKYAQIAGLPVGKINTIRDALKRTLDFGKQNVKRSAEAQELKAKATEHPLYNEAMSMADEFDALKDTRQASALRDIANAGRMNSLEIYQERLDALRQKRGVADQPFTEAFSLQDFMGANANEKKKLDAYAKSAPPAARQVVERAGQKIQQVLDAVNSSGYAMADINAGSSVELQNIKSLQSDLMSGISRVLTQHNKLVNKHKTSSPEALQAAIKEAQNAVNRASTELRKFAQVSPEIRAQEQAITDAKRAADKAAGASDSLWSALTGKLDQGEVRDIFSKNPSLGQRRLQVKGGKSATGAQMSDLVADGMLDKFLPPDMRHDSPSFDEVESTELIKQKIREQDYLPFDTKIEIEQIFGSVQEAEKLVDEFLTIEEQNLELQTAADEQREGEIDARAIEPEVESRPAEPATREAREPEARPAAEQQPTQPERVYLNVPFKENESAKQRGALWDADRKLWYMVPIQTGMAKGEYNINLTRYIPDAYAVNRTKDEARAAAENMTIKTGREHRAEKITDGVDTGYGVVDADGVALNEGMTPTKAAKAPASELELATQTAEELKAKQDEIDRLTKENERLAKQAEAKDKADAERDEFVLTGSNRPADEAAARGQKDIFEKAQGRIEKEEFNPIKDADGKPIVVYRGSLGSEKETLKPTNFFGTGMFGKGINLTSSAEDASKYASTDVGENVDLVGRAEAMANALGISYAEAKADLTQAGGTVYPLNVSINNPLVVGKEKITVPDNMLRLALAESDFTGDAEDVDRFVRQFNRAADGVAQFEVAQRNGVTPIYRQIATLQNKDGLIIEPELAPRGKGATHYLAFDKSQVRSIFEDAQAAEESDLSFALGNIKQLAKDYNGEIVYGDDERGLIRAHGAQTGEPIYVPYVKDQMYQNDIEQFPAKSFGLKDSEYRELVQAKQDLEAKAADEHAKKPFLTIPPGITGSKGVPGKVTAVAKNWAKMLKLDGNIHIMTAEEALANKEKFTGPHRALGYMGFLNEPGIVKKVGPNDYVMIVRKSTNTGKTLEVIAHEFGHIHQRQVYENADVETKNALIKQFNAWFAKARGGTAQELIDSLRAKRVGRATQGDLSIAARSMKNQEYWFSFSEWYADQVSRWATTSEKPVSVVEKFFAKLGAALKKFFAQAKAAKFLPNETFAQYLEQVTTSVDFTPTEVLTAADQMPLFSKGSVDGEPPKSYQNYKGGELPPAEWDNLADSKLDTFQYKIVDKQIDTKRVIENIKKAVGDIADKFNAYIKEELYHGRTAKGVHDFLQKELLPLTKEMKAANVTIDEFDEYLHNRHAEEYNNHINKINPDKKELQDKGSGVSTKDARAYLAGLSDAQKATFESLAARIDKIVAGTQDMLVDTGIESKETIDAWRQTFPFYVPLKRDNLEYVNQGSGVGSGYGSKGGVSKRATGSLKSVIDIVENIAKQREQAIMKSEKARVGRALYGLAIQNPNPKFWLPINPDAIKNKDKLIAELEDLGLTAADAANIAKEPVSAVFNKKTGMVEYAINPLLRDSDNVFPIRINGQDRFIIFNGSDPRAKRMVESLKNLDAEQMGIALGTIGEVTRFMASVNTQYNPVFGAWNFLRDVQGAALNLTTTDIAGEESKVLKGVFPALKSIYSDLRSQRAGREPKGEWQELFERYQKAGGATGYKEQFSKGNDAPGIVSRELGKLDRGNVRQAADAVFNWLSDYNDAMENAVRLSAFKVALDKGLSEDKAASLAKNLTVNFNRKGAASPTLQALYAFFNASVQGTKRLAETLQGPAGKKIVAGGFTIGAIQAIALAMAGYDDDEPPQFLKDKNLILPMPGGDYLIVPMPMGFNIFPGIGRLTTEYILGQAGLITGAKGLGDKALDVTSLVLDSFNPLGSGSLLQIVSPTAFDPLAAIQSNKDAFGRPISKEDRATSPTPGFMRSREGATWLSKNIAELLNYVSSPAGTKYTKGAISPTADQLDYLAGQYTGGVGREVMKAGQYAAAVVKGETEDLPSYRVPIAGKLYGETTTPSAIASKFYMNVTELAKHENEIKQRMKNKEDVREYRAEHPETRFINRVNYIENQITALNKQKKALQEKDAPAERIKKIDEQKTALMKGLNDQIKKIQQ